MARNTVSLLALAIASFAPAIAHADATAGEVEVVKSQFTDKVESSNPVAASDQLASATRVTYWVAVKNAKELTTITLVSPFSRTRRTVRAYVSAPSRHARSSSR